MELVVEGPPEGAITVCVAVDGEAAVNECREGNNVHCLDLAGLCGAPEPPAIAISDVLVGEGDAGTVEAELTVALSAPAPLAVEVDYATADAPGVSATAGVDYQEIGGRLTIPEGGVAARLRVPVVVDVVDEGDELFAVVLADPVNAVLEDALGYGTIVDDDEALLAIDDVETEEGDAGTAPARFTIRLATVSDREIAVDYATVAETASAGEDFEPADGTLVFPPGTVAREVAVGVVGDLLLEPDETFRVELSGAVNTTMADPIGIGTIRDDEICAGPNLLVNPGAEARPDEGELPGWIEVAGSDWQRRSADPDPAEGGAYFFAGTAEYAELVQDVDVGAYAARIAAGEQIFGFIGAVRTADEAPPDVARIVAEYRDLNNNLVLEAFDSGEILSYEWHPV
ncbi:MAG: hypothetical protein GY856_27625, partial [bacterium]|nr:hypothetical protein [bacterium]